MRRRQKRHPSHGYARGNLRPRSNLHPVPCGGFELAFGENGITIVHYTAEVRSDGSHRRVRLCTRRFQPFRNAGTLCGVSVENVKIVESAAFVGCDKLQTIACRVAYAYRSRRRAKQPARDGGSAFGTVAGAFASHTTRQSRCQGRAGDSAEPEASVETGNLRGTEAFRGTGDS
jgi:hypothetical protein